MSRLGDILYTRAWQRRMRETGRCPRCGKPCAPYGMCAAHRKYDRELHARLRDERDPNRRRNKPRTKEEPARKANWRHDARGIGESCSPFCQGCAVERAEIDQAMRVHAL